MSLPVKLQDIVDEMDGQMDEMPTYINRKTGTIYFVTEEGEVLRSLISENLHNGSPHIERGESGPTQEDLESDDYVALPDKFDIHEWQMLKDFSESQENSEYREQLLDAIHGRGAFRHFKSTVERLGLREEWFRFRDAAYEEIAIRFLEENEIPYTRDQ